MLSHLFLVAIHGLKQYLALGDCYFPSLVVRHTEYMLCASKVLEVNSVDKSNDDRVWLEVDMAGVIQWASGRVFVVCGCILSHIATAGSCAVLEDNCSCVKRINDIKSSKRFTATRHFDG